MNRGLDDWHAGRVGDAVDGAETNRVLCVGPLPADQFDIPSARHITFAEVEGAVQCEMPDLVMSPLFAHHFDCVDLARLLRSVQYRGRYRVYANVPRPDIVRDEVRALAPQLDFDIVTTTSTF